MSIIYKNIGIAAIYVVLGLGSLVVNPPGSFTTFVWPSAGLALAAILIWGRPILPAIWIGSTLVHGSFLQNFASIHLADLVVASIAAGFGSALQAFVSYSLYKKLFTNRLVPASDRQFITLMLIGSLGCVISPLWGGFLLYSRLGLSDFQVWQLCFGWFSGNVIGLLLATPFFLYVVFNCIGIKTHQRVGLFAFLVFFLGLVNIGLHIVKEDSLQKNNEILAQTGQSAGFEIQQRMYSMAQALDSLRAYQLASGGLELREFNTIGDSVIHYEPSITTLAWAPRVLFNDVDSLLDQASIEVNSEYKILEYNINRTYTDAGQRSVYIPVYFAYPTGPDSSAGLDLLSHPSTATAIEKSLSRKSIFSTALYTKPRNGEPGVMFVIPVIQDQNADRQYSIDSNNFLGVMLLVFEPKRLIENIVKKYGLNRDFNFNVIDETDENNTLIYTNGETQVLSYQQEIDVFNRTWKMSFGIKPYSDSLTAYNTQNASYLFAIIASFFASTLSMTFVNRQINIENLIQQRTEQLSSAKNQAEAANIAKSQFLANVSHELRTPLNAVIGFTRRVLKMDSDELSQRSFQALTTVEKNALHLLSIINDLLDIAKIESGKVEIHKEVVSIEDVFADVKNDLIYEAQQRELYLDFKLPESELLVLTDRQRLIQVLFNLVSNGLKYTETGGVTVEAQIGSLNDHMGVWISVSDTGIGIANEELSTVFGKFVQASSRTHGTPGTGLGLTITRELVNLLGGQLEVDSTLGEGSVFRFWLPRYTK